MPSPPANYYPPNPYDSEPHGEQPQPARKNDLRHYPLLKGLQDVNVQQASMAAAQRVSLNASQNVFNNPELAQQNLQSVVPEDEPPEPAFTGDPAPPFVPPVRPNISPAEQLQRINQSLPDGVRYEPMDENTLRILRATGRLPVTQPPVMPQPPSRNNIVRQFMGPQAQAFPPPPVVASPPAQAPPYVRTPDSIDPRVQILESLIQDESNGYVFYSHLAGLSNRADFRAALGGVAEDCQSRIQIYNELLERMFSHRFEPSEVAVNTRVNFKDGLTLAIQEENKSLRTLSDLLEKLQDNLAERAVQNIINKKIIGHNLLSFMKNDR
ncbi:MAG: ferritin-like domain-containing protein [Clostridiales bacterium]|jgi:hypothetical protein|nr:ferritin-like domain-containing protein [Clostridiales bacterium]